MFNIDELVSSSHDGCVHVHFIGVCGTAMAGVAAELHARGLRVTGSDSAAYPPMSTFLQHHGIRVFSGFRAEALEPAPDLVVVGNAVSRGNPEVEAVLDRGLPYCSLPEFLRWAFLRGRTSLVVTGTHGKTTTAALCAWGLHAAGRDPSWLVGGVPVGLEQGFRVAEGEVFVIEGDEYDTAFFDKRAKFLHYQARVLILNNLEFDHADIYDSIEDIRRSFRHLLRTVPRSGKVVANIDEPEVARLAELSPCPVVSYSVHDSGADWYAQVAAGQVSARGPGGVAVELSHQLVGAHQAWNVLAASAALHTVGLTVGELERVVASFPGVKRRAELRGKVGGISVYDDFAHHPTAIRGTLEGFRERYRENRIWAVVEPRSNTMRRRVFQETLIAAFDAADAVLLREAPNPEKVPADQRLDVDQLARDVTGRNVRAEVFPDAAAIVVDLLPRLAAGDVVVVLSNGGFEGIHERILDGLAKLHGGKT
jgi:UDP-N-acetylmuramate: L-alanyl-gamma-D-glutamyl-meso-diaminopimelate ligase